MDNRFERLEMLIGSEALSKLNSSSVAIFGVGGVGGYVAEALARSGIGSFLLVDNDVVSASNINRQIIALDSTIGMSKVDIMTQRIHDINPSAIVESKNCFFLPENADSFDFSSFDYVADCVDTVTAKVEIIRRAKEANCKVISAMGAGGKMNPAMFEVSDISKTSVCPLAKVMRRELKARKIKDVKVVFSKEEPIKRSLDSGSRHIPGSCAFSPSVAGLIMASEIVKDLIQ